MADELEFSLDSYVSRSTPIVIGSLSSADTAEYTSTTEFIAKAAERKGSYDVSAADTDKYTDDAPTSFANIAYCVISDDSIVMSNGKGTMTISKGSFVKGKPVLHFQPVASLPGVVVSNLGATSSDSQVGMASKKFDHVWANNLNNNPITDTNNQTLSVDGATSIVGALNQINSHLAAGANPRGTCLLHAMLYISPLEDWSHTYTVADPSTEAVKYLYCEISRGDNGTAEYTAIIPVSRLSRDPAHGGTAGLRLCNYINDSWWVEVVVSIYTTSVNIHVIKNRGWNYTTLRIFWVC